MYSLSNKHYEAKSESYSKYNHFFINNFATQKKKKKSIIVVTIIISEQIIIKLRRLIKDRLDFRLNILIFEYFRKCSNFYQAHMGHLNYLVLKKFKT